LELVVGGWEQVYVWEQLWEQGWELVEEQGQGWELD